MSTLLGDCFVVHEEESLIFGRNSHDESESIVVGVAVCYYEGSEAIDGKTDGGAEVSAESETFRIILQKPSCIWGGDCGANEHNVCVAITWADDDIADVGNKLLATDIVRLALATSTTAELAVERVGELVASFAGESSKINFFVCDTSNAWLLSSASNLWVAQKLKDSYLRLPYKRMAVTTFEKSSDAIEDSLKTLGIWNGDLPLNFAACFTGDDKDIDEWCGPKPDDDVKYTQASMFETLRAAAATTKDSARSAIVFELKKNSKISCYWFTGTPNANESVFKPFVFSPQPKISPLTVPAGETNTKLHKLHAQRKPEALEDLKELEASCVAELNSYIAAHSEADDELDELLKDCVEAEVKFYR